MTIPAGPGLVWKRTAEGLQHQVKFDDDAYDSDGRLKARCGTKVTPTLDQAVCPGCLTGSPAAELADAMEARTAEAFAEALTSADDEAAR